MSYRFVAYHDLSFCWADVGRGEILVDVAAVVVRERVLESPGRPVLDRDDAPDAKLLHQGRVVAQVVQLRTVTQGAAVVDQRSV